MLINTCVKKFKCENWSVNKLIFKLRNFENQSGISLVKILNTFLILIVGFNLYKFFNKIKKKVK